MFQYLASGDLPMLQHERAFGLEEAGALVFITFILENRHDSVSKLFKSYLNLDSKLFLN